MAGCPGTRRRGTSRRRSTGLAGSAGVRAAASAIALALLAATATGCVERRFTIRTNPPGALAIVNGEEIGTTPVSKSFTYYGDRDVVLIRDGYQTTRRRLAFPAPWWDNIFTEFFTENLLPITLRDEREIVYNLEPARDPDQNTVLDNANRMRERAQIPPPPAEEPGGGPFGLFRRR